ncbi:MAG: hypothetical protein KAU16_02305 [Methanophagales archaeon]|nr:hypothetical protein [Methanophagales archaeon]
MFWKEFFTNIVFNYIGKISSRLKKYIYPLEELKEDIIIDVRSINPIMFHSHNIPVVTIYFTITNMSQYLTLTIDRLIFKLWLESEHRTEPLFHKAHCLEKEEIKIKERRDIFCELDLNNPQIQKLEKVKEGKEPPTANITVTAYFNSKLYEEVEIKKHLEYIPYKIR